jgi:hypothetical protein
VATGGRLALTAIVLAAASCAAPGFNNPVAIVTSGLQHAVSCRSSISASPRYRMLAAHMPLSRPTDATLEQLADDNYATASEAEALVLWHQGMQSCRNDLLSIALEEEPLSLAIIVPFWNREDEIYVGIIKQKLTWGQGLLQLRQILADALTKFADQTIRLNVQSNSAKQAELSRRVSILNALVGILP